MCITHTLRTYPASNIVLGIFNLIKLSAAVIYVNLVKLERYLFKYSSNKISDIVFRVPQPCYQQKIKLS